ncbi:MAG: DUF177 domain-containing protein [Fibrobacterota bacterium]
MKLDLRNLVSGNGKLTLPIVSKDVDADILRLTGNGTLELTYDNCETSLTGRVYARAALLLECARCLREFTLPVEAEFPLIAKMGVPGNDDDENTLYFTEKEPVIDLAGLVTEELTVNAPMKAVCSEACKGLCPGCGADLNEKGCDCNPEKPNPAWDALRKLKLKREK